MSFALAKHSGGSAKRSAAKKAAKPFSLQTSGEWSSATAIPPPQPGE